MELKRVVVTGIGVLSPIGSTIQGFYSNLINGVSGADKITKFDASNFKTQIACELKDYNPLDYFDRKESRKLDPCAQYGIISAEQAVKDSNIDFSKIDPYEVGVIWGSGIGGMDTFFQEVSDFANGEGNPRFNPFFIPKMIANITAGHISMKYGLKGPNYGTISACASSANAISSAFDLIRLGKAKVFVVGGSEAAINEVGIGGFNSLQAISKRNDDPKTASRPFDKDRDGFVMAEGGASLVIEDYEHAIARGADIYCELVGTGMSADAHHLTAPEPEGRGAKLAMANALKDANVKTGEIDYINVHGTSTPLGDRSEITAIKSVFGTDAYALNISSTKSMTGHLLGAAGAVESVISILALLYDTVPPTINHFELDPELDPLLNYTFNFSQKRKVNIVMTNAFGFGGHNTSLIFKKVK